MFRSIVGMLIRDAVFFLHFFLFVCYSLFVTQEKRQPVEFPGFSERAIETIVTVTASAVRRFELEIDNFTLRSVRG